MLNTTTNTASINDDFEASKIKYYPNPTTGNFVVEANGSHIAKIEIFDINGKTVYENYSVNQTNQSINITGLAKGIYVLKIHANAKSFTQKVVISEKP